MDVRLAHRDQGAFRVSPHEMSQLIHTHAESGCLKGHGGQASHMEMDAAWAVYFTLF